LSHRASAPGQCACRCSVPLTACVRRTALPWKPSVPPHSGGTFRWGLARNKGMGGGRLLAPDRCRAGLPRDGASAKRRGGPHEVYAIISDFPFDLIQEQCASLAALVEGVRQAYGGDAANGGFRVVARRRHGTGEDVDARGRQRIGAHDRGYVSCR